MYVNQIDNTIDKMLDDMFLDMGNSPLFTKVIKTLNYVEFIDDINKFIQTTIEKVDLTALSAIINNKENITRIIYIFKRYITYYYFLSIAFHYTGNVKDFRNNLIQFTKLQLNSKYLIKNFFDSENNYKVIKYFKIIKDSLNILTLTELQIKALDRSSVSDAIEFLNTLEKKYIDNFIFSVDNKSQVKINSHNLIKTIVFKEIYVKQEQLTVFEIVNERQENELEYRYIDIVVNNDLFDVTNFSDIVDGDNNNVVAQDLVELLSDTDKTIVSIDKKNNNLICLPFVVPIVDDFLRYHNDGERIEIENDTNTQIYLNNKTNTKNIQYLILEKQRQKKMNPKAQAIVTKLDLISDFYLNKTNNIEKYFYQPMKSRKVILANYLEELRVTSKIVNLGKKAVEKNEYFLELNEINSNAYFNFKNFKKYGTEIVLETESPINMIRYSNIENININANSEVEYRSGKNEYSINLVGLIVGPFSDKLLQCVRKKELLDIRTIEINYWSAKVNSVEQIIKNYKSQNSYKMFLKLIKNFYVDSIQIKINENNVKIFVDYAKIISINPKLRNKTIYWIYDIELDIFHADTYESSKSSSSLEYIKLMNAQLYEKIQLIFLKKLYNLIEKNNNYSLYIIEQIITEYTKFSNLNFGIQNSREFIISQYLAKQKITQTNIKQLNSITRPQYTPIDDKTYLRIKIDMRNPYKISEYMVHTNKHVKSKNDYIRCQHEVEWNELEKLKKSDNNLNKYNLEITKFIEKYSIETKETEFICKICGQVLKIKMYVQDGNYDNSHQRFVSAYLPSDISLESIKEYKPYLKTIAFLEKLTNKISLISGTNVFVGNAQNITRQKALVKSTIDIILKHNSTNLLATKKNIGDLDRSTKIDNDARSRAMNKMFNIDNDYDSIFYFELDDRIFDSNISAQFSSNNVNLNKSKLNNIYLYFMLMFITELNGAQISMMFFDRIANIYIFTKNIDKIIGNLKIKKNLNSHETVFIKDYPVLCYLIFLISYYFSKYNLWYYPTKKTNSFNPLIQKNIIHSFVDLINSIMLDGGTYKNDYVYIFTTSKFYSQLNSIFKNTSIIKLLKVAHAKYSQNITNQDTQQLDQDKDNNNNPVVYYVKNPFKQNQQVTKLATYKISSGIMFGNESSLNYVIEPVNNNKTNCTSGDFHKWNLKSTPMVCEKCSISIDESSDTQLMNASYYFNLKKIANTRCLDGKFHDFMTTQQNETICKLCKLQKYHMYTNAELDTLNTNINQIENANIETTINDFIELKQSTDNFDKKYTTIQQSYENNYLQTNNNQYFGSSEKIFEQLINEMINITGADTNLSLGSDKHPIYLNNTVYIVDHLYNATAVDNPVVFTTNDNNIKYREQHPFFKIDVFYYTDNRTIKVDVFYDAETRQLLGYKELHKDYVVMQKSGKYLKINLSIKEKLSILGYSNKYIDTNKKCKMALGINRCNDSNNNKQNIYFVLNNLIKTHIISTKKIVDTFSSILFNVKHRQLSSADKNNNNQQNDSPNERLISTIKLENIISKYGQTLDNFKLGENDECFSDWINIKSYFVYKKVEWQETDVIYQKIFNCEKINYYDFSSNVMFYYLVTQLIKILKANNDKKIQSDLSQLYIEIINYIYSETNNDIFADFIELKREDFIINMIEIISVNLLKKGQGLDKSSEFESQIDNSVNDPDNVDSLTDQQIQERDEAVAEADALDVEDQNYYFEDENEDYAENIENDN